MKAQTTSTNEIVKFKKFISDLVNIRVFFDLDYQDCGTLIISPSTGEINYTTLSGLGIYSLKDGVLTFTGRRKSFSDGVVIEDYLQNAEIHVSAAMHNNRFDWELIESAMPELPI